MTNIKVQFRQLGAIPREFCLKQSNTSSPTR